MVENKAFLRLVELNVEAGDKKILADVNLELFAGQKVALFGENGAGKSSLLRALMGVGGLQVSGKILFDDEDLTLASIDQRARAGIGLFYQEPPVLKNVKLINLLEKMSGSFSKNLIEDDFLERGVNVGLSGGEKKRLELAQMIVMRPQLWLIDELDSGVDQGNLNLMGRELGGELAHKTALVVSHSGQIFDYLMMDRAIVLKNGRVVADGAFEPIYQSIKRDGYERF